MTTLDIMYFGKSTVLLVFYLSMPIIGAATVVGVCVAMFQTLIQLQEQTLGFASKLIAIIAVFMSVGGWMSIELMLFIEMIFDKIGS